MPQVLEINEIDQLIPYRQDWGRLLHQTVGKTFFQSLDWLEIYWRHFGRGQKLRALIVLDNDGPRGIVPLVVRREATRVGRVRTLTFPLHDWASFYGPIGPEPESTLTAALKHIRRAPRDWDMLELRWLGMPGAADPACIQRAMLAAGLHACPSVWGQASVVEMGGAWDVYWASRQGAWLRRFHHAERALEQQGEITHIRYRPLGQPRDDGSPRWDLYDACEEIARRSWQGSSADGTTLSHASVRGFFRETHEAAAKAGAVDLNLLLLDGRPAAFVYGYCDDGYLSGLRRGYDATTCSQGAGTVLLARVLRDSFQRGDRIYDMGVGYLKSKRHFQTRLLPIWRLSHFAPWTIRPQLLRAKRWWQSRRGPAFTAVGRAEFDATDAR